MKLIFAGPVFWAVIVLTTTCSRAGVDRDSSVRITTVETQKSISRIIDDASANGTPDSLMVGAATSGVGGEPVSVTEPSVAVFTSGPGLDPKSQAAAAALNITVENAVGTAIVNIAGIAAPVGDRSPPIGTPENNDLVRANAAGSLGKSDLTSAENYLPAFAIVSLVLFLGALLIGDGVRP